jgi:AraC family transcriptional regulator, regulatory protein of adaptative response / methylated-DNA-[protein]-cysteine methyltransferase
MNRKRLPNRADLVLNDPRWTALVNRDRNADGGFFYSVESTGVYCRPSCGARTPLPENVQFHATTDEAEAQGFRACKRCKPKELHAANEITARIAAACREIESSETVPSLQSLALAAGMSRFHFQRTFKFIAGITPGAYASAHRAARVRKSLRTSKTVTDAIYEAGFNSSSRFYEGVNGTLGMTPTAFRAGGLNAEIYFAIGACSLGHILAAQTERGVCAILIGDDTEQLVKDL